jgi:hypothetical protein
MTLLEAISTGRPYSRTGGAYWIKSPSPHYAIRNVQSGEPFSFSTIDILATDWVIDVRPLDAEYGWICTIDQWVMWNAYGKEEEEKKDQ